MRAHEFVNDYPELDDLKWFTLPDGDYPIRDITTQIGATHYANWGKIGVPWSNEMIGGSGSYLIKFNSGYLLTDATVIYKNSKPYNIGLSQLSASNRGSGIGTKYMELLKTYADSENLPITIYKVTNRKFFDRFNWLKSDGDFGYNYKQEAQS